MVVSRQELSSWRVSAQFPAIRDELNGLAEVEFDMDEIVELAELAADYFHRFEQITPSPPIEMDVDIARDFMDFRKKDRDARRAFIEAVEAFWRPHRGGAVRTGKKRRGYYGSSYGVVGDEIDERHDGPLIRLIQYLIRAAGERPPPAATLHHDLAFLYTGRERAGHGSAENGKRR